MSALTASMASIPIIDCSRWCRPAVLQSHSRQRSPQLPPRFSCSGPAKLLCRAPAPHAGRSSRFSCRADASDGERLPEGARVRVKQSITVFHAPKRKEGLDLAGMEGEVVAYVDEYKGQKLSSNLPVKVKFVLDNDGKETKFFSHLAPEEIEAI